MMRTLLIGTALLAATACFAQNAGSPSVAVGNGEIVTLIQLKYLDPLDAAAILYALGYTGTIIPVNPPHGPGESMGTWGNSGAGMGGRQRGRGGSWGSSNRQNNNGTDQGQGYGNGYNNGNYRSSGPTTGQPYGGYQSPFQTR